MINEDILWAGGYATDEWQQELDGLQSARPGDVRKVHSGREAVELLEQKSFACVVVASGLADSYGPEFLLRLRTAAPDTPVVVLVLRPESAEDGILVGRGHAWVYQKPPGWTGRLPSVIKKIIGARACDGEERT